MTKAKTTAEIEFKVLNQQYNTALKSMRTENTSLNSTLKLNEAQFKATGDKGEYLKTKCDALTKQYDLSKQKVKETSDALEKTKATMGENSTEANKLKNSLNHATSEMYSLQVKSKAAKDELSKFSSASESLDKVSAKAKSASEGLKGISTAAIAVTGASVAAFTSVDKGYDEMIRRTGATGESAKELEKIYKEVGSSVSTDLSLVGGAIGEINTRFKFTGTQLEESSRLFLKFASINNVEVTEAVRLVSRAMGDAGIDYSEYANVLDMMTVASQKSGVSIDNLATNLAKYGAPMRALGFDTKESIALFSQWEATGVSTEIAFSGMKKAIGTFTKEGKDAKVEFAKTIQGIQDGTITVSDSMAIFGQKANQDMFDTIKQGKFDVEDFTKALDESSGAVLNTSAEMRDSKNAIGTAFNSIKISSSELGEVMLNSMVPAFDLLSKGISIAANWFGGLDENTQKVIGTVVLLVGGLSGGALAISKISKGIGALCKVMKIFSIANLKETANTIANTASKVGNAISTGASTVAQWAQTAATSAWNVVCAIATVTTTALGAAFAFLTSPIGLIVLAITAVIAIGVALITHWDEVCVFASETWNKITSIFQDFDAFLIGVFSTDWTESFGTIGSVLNAFFANASNIWDSIKLTFSGVIDFVAGVFTGDWSRAWSGVTSVFEGIMSGLGAIIKAPLNGVIGLINMAIDGINSISVDIPSWIPKWAGGGKHFSANLGHIEYLANGGIVTSPVLSMVGEGKDNEAVIPLNTKSVSPLSNMIVKNMNDMNVNNAGFTTRILDALQSMTFIFNITCYIEGTPFTAKINKQQMLAVKRGRMG